MMKILHSILTVTAFIICAMNVNYADNKPKRFSMPLDEETELKGKVNLSFIDYKPVYSYSDFINYNISRDSSPQNETSVKISKKDTNRVVAAFRDFRQGVNPPNRRVGYSYSTDGGQSWSESKLLDSTLIAGFPRNSDPAVGIDTAGNFYIAVICITYSGTGALAVYKSTDGGVTFPIAFLIANDGSEDKEYIATDLTPGSPYVNNLYISWTRFSGSTGIKLTKSTNGGLNWTNAVPINDAGHDGQGSDLNVGPDGEVYVSWLGGTSTDDVVYFDKSVNGGTSFGTDVIVATGATPNIPISSSGVTFPSLAVDVSGGIRNGYIYITWCDARNGDPDIFISRSTNRGVNWSAPLRVNEDPSGNGKLQCWPWISVNNTGNIAIVYYDSRNTTSQNIIEAYLGYSTDGGITFTNYRLSTVPTPTNQPNTAVRFGDYIGIDFCRNRIVPVWTDERAGGYNMECYTAIISSPVNINNLTANIPAEYKLNQNYPNPFNPKTIINYELRSATGGAGSATLKVFDELGRDIVTLVNEKKSPGSYSVEFDGSNLPSGVYFYKLETPEFTDVKRMILIK